MTREEKHQENLAYRREYARKMRAKPGFKEKQAEYDRRYKMKQAQLCGRDKVETAFATTWSDRAHFMSVNEEGSVILPLTDLLTILNETGAKYNELYEDGKFGIEVML